VSHPLEPYVPTKPYRAKPIPKVKLNIACGPNIFPYEGWTNYDKADLSGYWRFLRTGERHEMPTQQREVCKFLLRHHADHDPVVRHDMHARFPHDDDSVDYIYVGQAIEHMNRRTQVVPFLQECRRMLKPGGVLRMTTPDIVLLSNSVHDGTVDRFCADQPEWFNGADPCDRFAYLLFGAAGPNCTQDNYEGHFHLYGRSSMKAVLEEAGFTDITFDGPPMAEVHDEGMSHSFSVEATK
jgi:SAM-dependent methyltransferase